MHGLGAVHAANEAELLIGAPDPRLFAPSASQPIGPHVQGNAALAGLYRADTYDLPHSKSQRRCFLKASLELIKPHRGAARLCVRACARARVCRGMGV